MKSTCAHSHHAAPTPPHKPTTSHTRAAAQASYRPAENSQRHCLPARADAGPSDRAQRGVLQGVFPSPIRSAPPPPPLVSSPPYSSPPLLSPPTPAPSLLPALLHCGRCHPVRGARVISCPSVPLPARVSHTPCPAVPLSLCLTLLSAHVSHTLVRPKANPDPRGGGFGECFDDAVIGSVARGERRGHALWCPSAVLKMPCPSVDCAPGPPTPPSCCCANGMCSQHFLPSMGLLSFACPVRARPSLASFACLLRLPFSLCMPC